MEFEIEQYTQLDKGKNNQQKEMNYISGEQPGFYTKMRIKYISGTWKQNQ